MIRPYVHSFFVAFGVSLMLAGCGSNEGPSLGDWTLKTSELTLTEDLRVSETEEFYFGGIADVSISSSGKIAVADHKAGNVKVLRPDGSLAHTLGTRGEGPGEFQRVGLVQWARGDSLYAFDLQTSRLTVFAPAPPHPLRRTLSVSRTDGVPIRVRVSASKLLVEISSRVPPSDGEPRYRRVRFLSEAGVPQDTLFTVRRQRSVVVSEDGMFQFRPVPFGRESEIALGPDDRLYTGWQDSLRFVTHGLDGSSEEIASVPAPPVPIPDAARDSVLNGIENSALRQASASAMPETQAAFTNLVVDNDGRLWVRRPTDGPDADTVAWWVLDPDAKAIHEIQLPTEVDLEVVRDGNAYGTTTTEMGAPAVVQYNITLET